MTRFLKDDFSARRPVTQVPAAWFNDVAKILNGITPGVGININRIGPTSSCLTFEVDFEQLQKWIDVELEHLDLSFDDVEDNKIVVGEEYEAEDDDEKHIRITSKSDFAIKLNDVFRTTETSGEITDVSVKPSKVRFVGSKQGDVVKVGANGELVAFEPESGEYLTKAAADLLYAGKSTESTLQNLQGTVDGHTSDIAGLDAEVEVILDSLEQLIDIQISQIESDIEQLQTDVQQAQTDAEEANTNATDAQSRVETIEGDYLTSEDLTDLITKDEIPQQFINAIPNTYQGTIELGGRVGWNGTHITQQVRTLTMTAGLITNIGSWTTVPLIPSVQYSN